MERNNWKLDFNVDKCSLCTVSRKRNPIICNYNMGGKVLNRAGAQHDLGVLMSDTANFSDHIHAQVNKANKMLGFIRCTINGNKILSPTLRSLFVTLVRSHLKYASEIWSPKSVTMIKRIEGLQRRASKLMLPNLSCNERLKRLDLLPLVYRREVKDLSTLYKLNPGILTVHLIRIFNFVPMRD